MSNTPNPSDFSTIIPKADPSVLMDAFDRIERACSPGQIAQYKQRVRSQFKQFKETSGEELMKLSGRAIEDEDSLIFPNERGEQVSLVMRYEKSTHELWLTWVSINGDAPLDASVIPKKEESSHEKANATKDRRKSNSINKGGRGSLP